MKTSEGAPGLGLYVSACCIDEKLFDLNDEFSCCSKCGKSCEWDLVERVFSWKELDEDLETLAA